jgi:hypothetical protein
MPLKYKIEGITQPVNVQVDNPTPKLKIMSELILFQKINRIKIVLLLKKINIKKLIKIK